MNLPIFLKRKKLWKRFLILAFLIPTFLFSIVTGVLYLKQDEIVQDLINTLNKDFNGKIEVKDSHISPFTNFPYISIDLENVKIFEGKEDSSNIITDISEVFLGFDFWDIIVGRIDINDIKLKDGKIDLVQHLDGSLNIEVALTSKAEIKNASKEFHLAIHEIELENMDINKYIEETKMLFDALIYEADAKLTTSSLHTYVFFDSKFELNIINDGDTSFIKHKHFDLHTKLDYQTEKEILTFQPTKIQLENSEFEMKGSINFKDNMNLDMNFSGNKKNYNLIFAMAPEEFIPSLKKYENSGNIFFEVSIKGQTAHGKIPAITSTFGCNNGFFKNTVKNKKIKDLNFSGSFTNGSDRNLKTSELIIHEFNAIPDEGQLIANLKVTNFEDPEVNFQINTSFELNFLANFFNLTEISDLSGTVDMEMNFHDIINFDEPQHAIAKLNESYYTKLKITDLKFNYGDNNLPLKDLDLYAEMNGHEAIIDYCNLKIGTSDLSIHGEISDLPAILHHTNKTVNTLLNIKSDLIDLYELTGADSNAVNEKIKGLKLKLDFKSSAQALTEFKNLPQGEFYIENLYADLQNYPHTLHDFHADVIINDENFKIIDFKGMLDKSDFLFSGNLKHYDLWFADTLIGETEIDFNFVSKHIRLNDLLAYNGGNYVPKEYRNEELSDFKFHGNTKLHLNDSLTSIDFVLDRFNAQMKLHPIKFENFKGNIHYGNDHLIIDNFAGTMGHSNFNTTLQYYLGNDESIKKRDNKFIFTSSFLDVDEIINYNEYALEESTDNHDSTFNIYQFPFTNMSYHLDIKELNYHQHTIKNFYTNIRSTPKHYLYIDTLSTFLAGGKVSTRGYFNGSNPDMIYFSPNMYIEKIDLDKVLLKFDNFGQDHLVSENLHGKFTGHITGKIHMHTDLVPKIDDSEIHMQVLVEKGKLENFEMLKSFSDYFTDENLNTVRFDTLVNKMDIVLGVITIPKMTINSTLGFMEVSGTQDTDFNYEYNISVPWKMVTKSVASKLFKKKKDGENNNPSDEIQYADKKTKFVSIKLKGDSLDYSVSLSRRK